MVISSDDPAHRPTRYFNNLIDAHVLDRTGGPDDAAVDQILVLAEEGKLTLLLPHSVKTEIEHPNTPLKVKQRAEGLLFTGELDTARDETASADSRYHAG